jgi:hypothetical protein
MQPHNRLQITKEVQVHIGNVIVCNIGMHIYKQRLSIAP